ncbi:MAG TPA: hypothetical protein VM031_01350 [Phycisphaerae bacterium]|nr:hypothetical protein [Phycisphaerae bacterium]
MPRQKTASLPTIRLGRLRVSRLVLGSNPFFGFAHKGKPLARQMKDYFTDERICAVLDEAAGLGVTAVAAPCYPRWIDLWNAYRDRGGKLRTWIAQPDGEPRAMRREIAAAAKGGAGAVFIQGGRADEQFEKRRFATLRGWVECIKGLGLPAGLASHRHDTHREYERRGWPTDFYFQCFYRPTGERYRRTDRDRNAAAIAGLAKCVIAYKVLAAGRNEPKAAYEYAFGHLRPTDGLCVGIYPPMGPGMLAENVALTVKHSTRGSRTA